MKVLHTCLVKSGDTGVHKAEHFQTRQAEPPGSDFFYTLLDPTPFPEKKIIIKIKKGK